MNSLVEKHRPHRLADFIGVAEPKAVLTALAKQPYASAFLFLGSPGTGKTTMAQAFAEEIKGEIHHIPSRMCDLETVDRVTAMCHYRPMFGNFHVIIVDEADQATKPAQLAWLSKLDSTGFPPETVILFTANSTDKLEERFLQRCRVLDFAVPGDAELAAFLRQVWATESKAPCPDLAPIIVKSKNSARAALMLLEIKLLTATPPPVPWFGKQKRILVKVDGKWVHQMAAV